MGGGVGTVFNKTPALEEILDTLQCKFKTEDVAKKILPEKSALSNNVRKKVITKWNRDFYSSNESTSINECLLCT